MKLFLLTLATFGFLSSPLAGGFDHGNAGDGPSSEFRRTARDIMHRLDLLMTEDRPVYDTAKLRAALAKTNIISEEHVILDDGSEPNVGNYPSRNLIVVNRSRWHELREPNMTRTRMTIVLHELLFIAGEDERDFEHSSKLIDLLNVPNYSPDIWLDQAPVIAAQVECGGQVEGGPFVVLHISVDQLGFAEQASVTFQEFGNKYGYRFLREDMPQFFEHDDMVNNKAIVGLMALVNRKFPVSVKYVGDNYADLDLRTSIEEGRGQAATLGNFMKVWKGPGHDASETYDFKNVLCSVWAGSGE